ncbi:hypothetical protein NDU88_002702 [Pleurodeles waltl]|uniref:Uncharacterized protein n=1 Tax=Pleurodeles waltl TaxID=8319 RepID=A0AAV7TLE3_PLEWA|nr:hypothetical protein NDU88_002702 [Pleurodeles waltl]
MRRSAPGSIYDFRVAESKQEDAGDKVEQERRKSRREDSSAREEMRSGMNGDKENERSQDSEDDAEGRSEESLEGENRVRGNEEQASGGRQAFTPSNIPGGTWLNKVRFLIGGGKGVRNKEDIRRLKAEQDH